jgi:hypothetical protein
MIYNSTRLTIIPDGMVTLEANSTILGFGLKDAYKAYLLDYYRGRPFVIPTEYIEIKDFSTGPTETGLNCSTTLTATNVSELVVLFRRSPHDYTCFLNPEYHNFFMTLGTRNFPDKPKSTTSVSNYRMKTETDKLDGLLTPCNSYSNSLLRAVCREPPRRMRGGQDDSDNMENVIVGRPSANAINSDTPKTMNANFSIQGSPQHPGFPGDPYLYLNKEDDTVIKPSTTNRTPPVYATVVYAFWLFHLGGYGSLKEAQRVVFEKDIKFNEGLQKHFPELFNQLAATTPAQLLA